MAYCTYTCIFSIVTKSAFQNAEKRRNMQKFRTFQSSISLCIISLCIRNCFIIFQQRNRPIMRDAVLRTLGTVMVTGSDTVRPIRHHLRRVRRLRLPEQSLRARSVLGRPEHDLLLLLHRRLHRSAVSDQLGRVLVFPMPKWRSLHRRNCHFQLFLCSRICR